jgi:hypothetical protein
MNQSKRQHCTPFLIESESSDVKRLHRVPLEQPPFPEVRLQRLLFDYPDLLPVDELEPIFNPLICFGCEVPTEAGPIDLLYSSPDGYMTLVETKLWSNADARRTVIGQILDYAKEIATWSFEKLDNAVRKALRPEQSTGQGILQIMKSAVGEEFDQQIFTDGLVRNLRAGRMLLLVVGEGIREGVETLASYLEGSGTMQYSLGLVEMALHRLDAQQPWPLFVQPRLITRTVEIRRVVIEIRNTTDTTVAVSEPSVPPPKPPNSPITQEAFFKSLSERAGVDVAKFTKELLPELEEIGLQPVWGGSSVSMRLDDPGGLARRYTVLVLTASAQFYLGWLDYPSKDGYDTSIGQEYLKNVCTLVGGRPDKNGTGMLSRPISTLIPRKADLLALIEEFVKRMQSDADIRRR